MDLVLPPLTVTGHPELDHGYKADLSALATRLPFPIQQTPASMGVVTQDFIEDRAARDVGEALEQVSNTARGNSQRLGSRENVFIRGFLVSGGFRGLRYDGLPGADPLGTWPPDAVTIERYEVLKGPASVLGGSGSPGRIVNVVSKRPEAVDFAEAEAQLGSFDLYRIAADANGVLPSNSALRGRLIAAFEDGGNFVDGIEERQLTVMPALSAELFDGAGHLRLSGAPTRISTASPFSAFRCLPMARCRIFRPSVSWAGMESTRKCCQLQL